MKQAKKQQSPHGISGQRRFQMINILGQEYDYQEIDAKTDSRMEGVDGYCAGFGHTIRVNNSFSKNDQMNESCLEEYKQLLRRHEIIHAFFHESGLTDEIGSELMVEWIAKQFPKMAKVFIQVGAI